MGPESGLLGIALKKSPTMNLSSLPSLASAQLPLPAATQSHPLDLTQNVVDQLVCTGGHALATHARMLLDSSPCDRDSRHPTTLGATLGMCNSTPHITSEPSVYFYDGWLSGSVAPQTAFGRPVQVLQWHW